VQRLYCEAWFVALYIIETPSLKAVRGIWGQSLKRSKLQKMLHVSHFCLLPWCSLLSAVPVGRGADGVDTMA
jgi:hypothetical protein